MKAGTLPDLIKRWEAKIEERVKFSPLALAGHVGARRGQPLSCTSGPYESLDERAAVRDKARADGRVAAPGRRATPCSRMANKIMMPAAFSPVQ